jgi:hypothetical protein
MVLDNLRKLDLDCEPGSKLRDRHIRYRTSV